MDDKKILDELSKELASDADKMGDQPRFGFFSIPYSAYIGDRFYSQDKQKIYRTNERKVITEPRGIYTKPSKQGKFSDAFFSNFMKVDKELLTEIEQKAKQEKEEYLQLVKSRKKGVEGFKQTFKPGGPQEYKDFYDHESNKVKYEMPITKIIDKKMKIDREHRSVFMEKRGIYTQNPKFGTSSTPGILFSSIKDDKKLLELKNESVSRSKSAGSKEKKDYKIPFKPPGLAKSECFQSNGDLFGQDGKEFKELLSSAIDVFQF